MRIFNVPYRLFLFSGLSLTLPGLMLWIVVVHLPLLAELDRIGQRAVAEVTFVSAAYDRVRATRGGGVRDVHFRFATDDGTSVEGVITEYAYARNRTAVGDTFGITYNPDDPSIYDTDRGGRYADEGMLIPLGGLSLLVLGLSAWEWRRLPPGWRGPRLWPLIQIR